MEDSHDDVWYIEIGSITQLVSRQSPPDENLWKLLPTTGETPGKIANHRAVVIGNKIYIYGGLINNDNQDQSLYCLNVESGEWKKILFKVSILIHVFI